MTEQTSLSWPVIIGLLALIGTASSATAAAVTLLLRIAERARPELVLSGWFHRTALAGVAGPVDWVVLEAGRLTNIGDGHALRVSLRTEPASKVTASFPPERVEGFKRVQEHWRPFEHVAILRPGEETVVKVRCEPESFAQAVVFIEWTPSPRRWRVGPDVGEPNPLALPPLPLPGP